VSVSFCWTVRSGVFAATNLPAIADVSDWPQGPRFPAASAGISLERFYAKFGLQCDHALAQIPDRGNHRLLIRGVFIQRLLITFFAFASTSSASIACATGPRRATKALTFAS
jgi:hypothetical protein